LISAIAQYDDNNEGATLEGFLQEVSLVADIDSLDNQEECRYSDDNSRSKGT
jgi:hypothetical protein